jgi:hypothetical protein
MRLSVLCLVLLGIPGCGKSKDIHIGANDLIVAYRNDTKAANAKYKNRILVVTGEVAEMHIGSEAVPDTFTFFFERGRLAACKHHHLSLLPRQELDRC